MGKVLVRLELRLPEELLAHHVLVGLPVLADAAAGAVAEVEPAGCADHDCAAQQADDDTRYRGGRHASAAGGGFVGVVEGVVAHCAGGGW